jgi:molecular chaperone DnaK (HSP70)
LQEKLKKQELGVHLNGDEAVCFGSAFIAANSSASYKVRKVYLTQHPSFQISIEVTPADDSKKKS